MNGLRVSFLTIRTTLGWCGVFIGCAYLASLLARSPAANPLAPGAVLNSLVDAGAFNLVAYVMVLRRVTALAPSWRASPGLIALALGLGLICAIPSPIMTALALAIFAVTLLRLRPKTPGLGQAGMLGLALAASIGSPHARLIHLLVGRLDARLVAGLLGLLGVHVSVAGNMIINGRSGIEVLAACASSAALPGFVLAYIVIAILLRGSLRRSDLPWLCAVLLLSIILTEIHLALMVPSQAAWNYWHNTGGLTIYQLTALSLACLFPVLAGVGGKDRLITPQPAQ